MEPQQPPPDNDPYRAMWQMTPVGDAGQHGGRRKSELRFLRGIIAGLVGFLPFGVVTTAAWGFWNGDVEFTSVGFAFLFIGLAAGSCLGGYIASERDN